MTEENKPLSIEEMEALMKQIEDGEGLRPEPEAPAEVVAEVPAAKLKRDNPLALKQFVDADTLRKDVEISVIDLSEEMRLHPRMMVHYGYLASLARRQFDRMKVAMGVLEARLNHIHRERITEEGKKATEAGVEAAVKSDPRWWEGQQRLIDSRAIYDIADVAREAFMQRRDMMIQIAADLRNERKGELRMMEEKTVSSVHASAREIALRAAESASQTAQEMLNKG